MVKNIKRGKSGRYTYVICPKEKSKLIKFLTKLKI